MTISMKFRIQARSPSTSISRISARPSIVMSRIDSDDAWKASFPNIPPPWTMKIASSAMRSSTVAVSPALVAAIHVSTSARIARSSSDAVSIILPSLLADQRHEAHAAKTLLDQLPLCALRDLDQLLHPAWVAQRHDDAAARRELVDQRPGHVAAARSGDDRVIGSALRPALGAVALDDLDIAVAEPLEPLARHFDQFMLPLHADHRVCDAADDRSRVT